MMENKHKKIRKKRKYVSSNNYNYNTPIDNSRYIKVFIVISIYVFIATLLFNFFTN